MHQLILASQSPRRRQLLGEAGYQYRAVDVKLSEIIDKNLNPRAAAEQLARTKGKAYLKRSKLMKGEGFLVLSADTIVVFEGTILGKPKNATEAETFLNLLSDKVHSVITAICVWDVDLDQEVIASAESLVWFRQLKEEEIRTYIESGEPFDKAGGYGIQGSAGAFVKKLEGSFSNVVGFPLELFAELEVRYGWRIRG